MNDTRTLITAAGQEKIRGEIEQLRERLRAVSRQKADAASETANAWHDNAAYEVAQAEEHLLLQRIANLEGLLRRSTLVTLSSAGLRDRIGLGSRAEVRFDDGETMVLTIRGAGEVDLANGIISASAPLAAAILNAREGERRTYTTGGMVVGVTVVRILEGEG